MESTIEFCAQPTYAHIGGLDTLCAIRAMRPHVVLPFKAQEKGCSAGKGERGRSSGSAGPLTQVQNGYAAPVSKAVS